MNTTNTHQKTGVLAVTCLAIVLAMTACQQEGTAEKAGKQIDQAAAKAGKDLQNTEAAVSAKAESTGECIDDLVITATIKKALLSDDLLKASQIEVTTVNGVVKLSGTLASEQLIGRAIELANSQKNVKSVQNELILTDRSVSK